MLTKAQIEALKGASERLARLIAAGSTYETSDVRRIDPAADRIHGAVFPLELR